MKHLLTAYLALSLIAGTVSLFVLHLVNRRLHNRVLTYYVLACIGLLASVLHNLVLFYLGINISGKLSPGAVVLMFSTLPTSYMMQLCIPLMVHRLYRVSWEKTGNRIAFAIIALQLLVSFSPWYMQYSPKTEHIAFGIGYLAENFMFIFFLLYALTLGFLLRGRLKPELGKVIRNFLVLLLVSLPGLIHDQLYFASRPSVDSIPVVIIYFPLYFLALSVANIVYGLRFLASEQSPALHIPATQASPAPSAIDRLDSLSAAFSLSEREKEIAGLVVEGLGNKQIADRLGISAKTVNNHVYNLFQKLKINSRFELMALLSENPPK